MEHEKDSDCTIDPKTDLCVGFGVIHGDVCTDCGQRGYHRPDCVAIRPTPHN